MINFWRCWKGREELFGRTLLIVVVHALVIGLVIGWWGILWLPQYLKFHENKGYLNPDLIQWVQPWVQFLHLGPLAFTAGAVIFLLIDSLVVFFLVRTRYLQWLCDYWSLALFALPLICILWTGTKMLESYWGLHKRIETQRNVTIRQRGQEFASLVGTWKLISQEKDGVRQSMEQESFELVVEMERYRWRGEKGVCLGSWNVYSSSAQNEMSFVPDQINESAWGGQGYYRVTKTRLALHLVNTPAPDFKEFDTRSGGEIWIFKRQ
jgi:hypothetical protein